MPQSTTSQHVQAVVAQQLSSMVYWSSMATCLLIAKACLYLAQIKTGEQCGITVFTQRCYTAVHMHRGAPQPRRGHNVLHKLQN